MKYYEFINLDDRELFDYCRRVGLNARIWRRRFVALLPEVSKRHLYKKHGFHSIYEFAAKFGSVSNGVVDDVLRLDCKLADLPCLRALVCEVGVNKVRVVAGIADASTDSIWAERVKEMSQKALEVLVRDLRLQQEEIETHKAEINESCRATNRTYSQNMLLFEKLGQTSLFDNEAINEMSNESTDKKPKKETLHIPVNPETRIKLLKFKKKLEKEKKEPVDWDLAINMLVERAENVQKTVASSQKQRKQVVKRTKSAHKRQKMDVKGKTGDSRYINVSKRQELEEQFKGKCSVETCNKPATNNHHPESFALTGSHENIKPLCKEHHEIAHNGLIENETKAPGFWKMIVERVKYDARTIIDQKFIKFKNERYFLKT